MMYDFICSVPAPVKPCKKLYCSDESYAVPRSTLYRWKSNKSRKSLTFGEVRGTVLTSKFLELETMFISHKKEMFCTRGRLNVYSIKIFTRYQYKVNFIPFFCKSPA